VCGGATVEQLVRAKPATAMPCEASVRPPAT